MSCESANYPEQDPVCDCFGCFEKRQEAVKPLPTMRKGEEMAEPQFAADNRFEITCGHCGDKFWMFDLLAIKVCQNCLTLGHRGNGGTCWKCRSNYYSDDEPFATHGDD